MLIQFKFDRKPKYLSKFISVYHIVLFDHHYRFLGYSSTFKIHFKC